MRNQRFAFLKNLMKNPKDTPSPEEESLREQARTLQKAHNALIESLWKIEAELTNIKDPAQKEALNQQKTTLEAQIDPEFDKQLNNLLEQIKDLEIKRCGDSKIGSHSPYRF